MALLGHQVGVVLAMAGWAAGPARLAVVHLLWLLGARVWFELATRRQRTAG